MIGDPSESSARLTEQNPLHSPNFTNEFEATEYSAGLLLLPWSTASIFLSWGLIGKQFASDGGQILTFLLRGDLGTLRNSNIPMECVVLFFHY